ncbi:MAG: HdeD family acid-resistance protein [Bacteroidota bacterium]
METLKSTIKSIKNIKRSIKNWWVLLLLGIVFIGMGILVFSKPMESYVTLAVFFSISMVFSGIFQSWFAFSNKEEAEGWGWQLALGIMELILGLILMFNMHITIAILPFYVGFWLLFRSFALIGFSFELKSYQVMDWGYYLVFGLILTLFSWFIILNPLFGGMTIVTWTGIALIIAGIAHIMLSFKIKKLRDLPKKISSDLVDKYDSVISEIQKEIASQDTN